MDQELKPLTVIILLLFFGSLLAGKFWAGGKALDVPRLTHLARHPDGRLFALAGDSLFAWRHPGGPAEAISLNQFGAHTAVGDLAFFSNGDLLLRRGPYQPSLLENLFRFNRLTPPGPETSPIAEHGLARCRVETRDCQPFGDTRYRLNSVFHLAVEPDTDRVILADTDRHRLILLSPDGTELDRLEGEFRFPNHVLFHAGTLYVADTNHHRIARVAIGDGGFGAVQTLFRTNPTAVILEQRTWPSAMLPVDREWWVINNDNDMGDGFIHRFNSEGELLGKISLPDKTEPSCLLNLGRGVLIADYDSQRLLYAVGDNSPASEVKIPGLDVILKKRQEDQTHYERIDAGFTWAFALSLLGGFFYALRGTKFQLRTPPPSSPAASPSESSIRADDPRIQWLERTPWVRRLKWLLPLLFGLLLLNLAILNNLIGACSRQLYQLEALLVIGVSLPVLYTWAQMRARLGIIDDMVAVMDWRKRFAVGKGPRVLHSVMGVIVDEVVVVHSTRKGHALFEKQRFENEVRPLLAQGQSMSNFGFERLQYRYDPAALILLLALLGLIVMGIALYFGI